MNKVTEPIVTEEPLPGWLRFEPEGGRVWFKTPVPRTVIRDASMLKKFLDKEHSLNRMLDVNGNEFSFKRRYGLKQRKAPCSVAKDSVDDEQEAEDVDAIEAQSDDKTILQRLSRNTDVVDHRKLLFFSSQKLDKFRDKDPYHTPHNFEEIKNKVSSSGDLRDMLASFNEEIQVVEAFDQMFSDKCLTEISTIDVKKGPLVEFPSSINQNLYCKIVEFGISECPGLMQFVISMVVRRGEPVLASHVFRVATLFSTICYVANQDLNALVKLRLAFNSKTNKDMDNLKISILYSPFYAKVKNILRILKLKTQSDM